MCLRVVLATDRSGYMAPIIPILAEAGAEIVAHVAPPGASRWHHAGGYRFTPMLRRPAPSCRRLAFVGVDDWPRILAALQPLTPDLIVSAFLPRRLPPELLALARLGGVNLHPARLPWYAGASPLRAMFLQGDELRFGGMTLHSMTEKFDAGPIIGAATLDPRVWRAPAALNAALAGAAASLCAGPLQHWLADQITPREQIAGAFPRGRIKDHGALDATEVSAARVQHLMRLFRRGLMIAGPQGAQHAGYLLRHLGPPTGEAPRQAWPRRLQFDCADARLEARHPFGLERRLHRLSGHRPSPRPTVAPIAPASVLTADQNADCIARMAACNPSDPDSTPST